MNKFKHPWDLDYFRVESDYSGDKIGGLPTFKKKILWPFYENEKGLTPMKFLAQLRIDSEETVLLFLGVTDDEVAEDFTDFFGEQTAAYVEGRWRTSWVIWEEIDEIKKEWCWNANSAASFEGKVPDSPFWWNYPENFPEGYEFFFQITEQPADIDIINISMETYILRKDYEIIFCNIDVFFLKS